MRWSTLLVILLTAAVIAVFVFPVLAFRHNTGRRMTRWSAEDTTWYAPPRDDGTTVLFTPPFLFVF